MSKIAILDTGGEWEVWVGLDDGATPPDGLNYIIGSGRTRAEAIQQAQNDLHRALADLHTAAAKAQP